MYTWAFDCQLAHPSLRVTSNARFSTGIAESRWTKRSLRARALWDRDSGALPDLDDAPQSSVISADAAQVMHSPESAANWGQYAADAVKRGFVPLGVASGTQSRILLARSADPLLNNPTDTGDKRNPKLDCGSDVALTRVSSDESNIFDPTLDLVDIAEPEHDRDLEEVTFTWSEQKDAKNVQQKGDKGTDDAQDGGKIFVTFSVRRSSDTVCILPDEFGARLGSRKSFLLAVKVQFVLERQVGDEWKPVRLRCSRGDYAACLPEALATAELSYDTNVIAPSSTMDLLKQSWGKGLRILKGFSPQVSEGDFKMSPLANAVLSESTMLTRGQSVITSHVSNGVSLHRRVNRGQTMTLMRSLGSAGQSTDVIRRTLTVELPLQRPLIFYADKPTGKLAVSVLASVDTVPIAMGAPEPVKVMNAINYPAPAGHARLALDD